MRDVDIIDINNQVKKANVKKEDIIEVEVVEVKDTDKPDPESKKKEEKKEKKKEQKKPDDMIKGNSEATVAGAVAMSLLDECRHLQGSESRCSRVHCSE